MTDYKKPVPEDRTVVPGTWSDILDCWLDSFKISDDVTSQNVSIANLGELMILLSKALIGIESSNKEILEQIKLLNLRFEEANETKLDERDL